MAKFICEICEKEKEHFAKGMCRNCYNKKWRKNNPESFNNTMKKYRDKNPEKIDVINGKSINKRYKREVCEIIKEHDIRHLNDPDSLDIKKFMKVKCE